MTPCWGHAERRRRPSKRKTFGRETSAATAARLSTQQMCLWGHQLTSFRRDRPTPMERPAARQLFPKPTSRHIAFPSGISAGHARARVPRESYRRRGADPVVHGTPPASDLALPADGWRHGLGKRLTTIYRPGNRAAMIVEFCSFHCILLFAFTPSY
jgi:hypothetical protein